MTETAMPRDPLRILCLHRRYSTPLVIQMMRKPAVTLPNSYTSTCYDKSRVKFSFNFRLWNVTSCGELNVGRQPKPASWTLPMGYISKDVLPDRPQ